MTDAREQWPEGFPDLFRRVRAWAVATGMIAGVAASLVLYVVEPDLGGVNAGLVTVVLNALLTFGLSALARSRPCATEPPLVSVPAPRPGAADTADEEPAALR
ncbi:hypothetical protein ACIRJS_28180 [Streptomyces sp. NPDC102340]|uniref:hypothetical protein n=1 Tax=unclassified Streptomyces TaxID=2593676 RepID=UPI0038229D71